MKRGLVLCLAMLMVACLGIGGLVHWCIGTAPGTRWLVETGGRVMGVEISMSRLSGALCDELSVENLHVSWQGGKVEIGDLRLAINEGRFWFGVLAVEGLTVHRLALQIEADAEAPASVDPARSVSEMALAQIPAWLEVTIDRLEITDFIFRDVADPGDDVVIANRIAGQYELTGRRLIAREFSYHSPYVELDGEFDWELTRPHLIMTAQVHLPATCVDPALFDTLHLPIDFPGHLEFDGDWNGYSGPVRFGISDETNGRVWLSARATGSWQGIRFDDLQGRYLEGGIAGNLDLSWADSFRMHSQLSGQALDLSALVEGVTGKTTLDVSGELFIPYDEQPLQANLTTVLHDGQFRNQSLQGRATGQWLGARLVNIDVDLSGGETRLLAKGSPAERVDIDLSATDLSALHADLVGQVAARGWVSWTADSLTGEIEGHAENLGWQETRLRQVAFHGRHPAAGAEIEIKLSGLDLSYGSMLVNRIAVDLTGNPAAHRLEITTAGPFGDFVAAAAGHYQNGSWTGRLKKLTGRETPWGGWLMTKTTALEWHEGVLNIDDLQLQGDQGTRLALDVEQWGSPDRAGISLVWTGFVLDWLEPYAGMSGLTGQADGALHYEASNNQPLAISGHVTANGQVHDEYFELSETPLELDFNWNQDGLQLKGSARSHAGEEVHASVTSSGPPSWNWPIEGLGAELTWQQLELARFNRVLADGRFEGRSEGKVSLEFTGEMPSEIRAQVSAQGRMLQGDTELGPNRLRADLHWDSEGFLCEATIDGMRGGQASLHLTSRQAPALAVPEAGQIDLKVVGLSLMAFNPWLPKDIEVAGTFSGNAGGTWDRSGDVDLSGQVKLLESDIVWSGDEGQLRLPLRDGMAEWNWADDNLSGSFSMNLAAYGDVKGEWRLPLPARIPSAFDPEGPLRVTVDGKVRAIGVLSSIGSWLVQDVKGETLLKLGVRGTWAEPALSGQIVFKDGGAYFPKTGILLEDIQLRAELENDRLRIAELGLRSGPGELDGRGELTFDGWALSDFRLDIAGDKLQVVDFPELQVLASPKLSLSGTPERISLQGSILIPKLTYKGSRTVPEVLPSKDVVIATQKEQRQALSIATDVRVAVALGDEVTLKSGGIETSLTGDAMVTMGPTGEFLAKGEIQLVSGSFNAYGTTLQIRQGLLNYNGDPVTNPQLRIFAAREVGEILAGVQVTGYLEAPVVTLYSRPTMPERDILGYMLMGRAIKSDSQETDMLMMGAGTLMPTYGGALAQQLGITEIDIQGLFVGSGGLRLRRKLTEKWEVESTLGTESGIDLYYILEFE